MEYVARNRDIVTQALMCPRELKNELAPEAAATLEELQAQLAEMPGRILSTAAEHQAELKAEVARMETDIEALHQSPGSWQLGLSTVCRTELIRSMHF